MFDFKVCEIKGVKLTSILTIVLYESQCEDCKPCKVQPQKMEFDKPTKSQAGMNDPKETVKISKILQ